MRRVRFLVSGLAAALVIGSCSKTEVAPDWLGAATSGIPTATATPSGTPTPLDYGNGQDGAFSTAGAPAQQSVNACFQVVSASNQSVALAGPPTGLQAGHRVLVIQMQDEFATSGDSSPITAPGTAGLWEVPRVNAINLDSLTLDSALVNTYASTGTRKAQLCTLPEYTTVTIKNGIALQPQAAWNGSTGGIVAFQASVSADIEGTINASGQGFRGGVAAAGGGGAGDTALDSPAPTDDGGKGEGLDLRSYALFGRGNYANGAGGGGGTAGGGGGGSGGGAGGLGGLELSTAGNGLDTQGEGGAPVSANLVGSRFLLGGGGGAGENSKGSPGTGGNGGGLVLLIVNSLSGGTGVQVLANGAAGGVGGRPNIVSDAAGGGGGGGTVYIQTATSTFAGTIEALGGAGGSPTDKSLGAATEGAGGGGGGGLINAVGLPATAKLDVSGAANGANTGNAAAGATAGGNGASVP